MNIAFRVDATAQIGTGHFMRCLTLADELNRHHTQIRFISRGLPEHLQAMLTVRGFELILLKNSPTTRQSDGDLAHSKWLPTSQIEDATETLQALENRVWDRLIVDHYALDARWEKSLRGSTRQIMVIDDLADRPHDCDLLLDQNYYTDMQTRYVGRVPSHCRLLLGPHYALLREEFRRLRPSVQPRQGAVKRILIFFGGVDADNYTALAIQALLALELKGIGVDVVIGAQHPYRSEIEQMSAAAGYTCYVQTTRMAELMAQADLAIGAGGSATWERCCLGLPTLSIAIAENQLQQLHDAAEAGLVYAPQLQGERLHWMSRHLQGLLENPALRRSLSTAAMDQVDGRGSVRMVSALAVHPIQIRTATERDSQQLFQWRNHPSIRAVSRDSAPLEWSRHQHWLASVLADPQRVLLIGQLGEQPMGVVRFDEELERAEISIYLVPEAGFTGQGRNLLLSAEQWLRSHRPHIQQIRAEVFSTNIASQRLFSGAGYQIESISYLKTIKGDT